MEPGRSYLIGEAQSWCFDKKKGRRSCRPFVLSKHSYFAAAAFFCSAQRLLTASAMRFRPSGVRFLFFFATFLAAEAPAFLVFAAPAPPSKVRALCNWAISRSICASISETPTFPPLTSHRKLDSICENANKRRRANRLSCHDTIRNCRLIYKQKMHSITEDETFDGSMVTDIPTRISPICHSTHKSYECLKSRMR